MSLPTERYGCVLADPPWMHTSIRAGHGNGLAADQYACMSTDDICRLDPWVASVTEPRCVLFLWATSAMLPDALRVMAAWGFAYRTVAFTWVKLQPSPLKGAALRQAMDAGRAIIPYHGSPYLLAFGNGRYTRAGAEFCLLGTRGEAAVDSRGERQVIVAPRREHSRKPDEQYTRIEALYPTRRRLEMFARRRRTGWAAWGNEIRQQEATKQ